VGVQFEVVVWFEFGKGRKKGALFSLLFDVVHLRRDHQLRQYGREGTNAPEPNDAQCSDCQTAL
jgi:hypothetical protein